MNKLVRNNNHVNNIKAIMEQSNKCLKTEFIITCFILLYKHHKPSELRFNVVNFT